MDGVHMRNRNGNRESRAIVRLHCDPAPFVTGLIAQTVVNTCAVTPRGR